MPRFARGRTEREDRKETGKSRRSQLQRSGRRPEVSTRNLRFYHIYIILSPLYLHMSPASYAHHVAWQPSKCHSQRHSLFFQHSHSTPSFCCGLLLLLLFYQAYHSLSNSEKAVPRDLRQKVKRGVPCGYLINHLLCVNPSIGSIHLNFSSFVFFAQVVKKRNKQT